jgi:LmbE family N-acetylglucosaminyl deacetylase
MAVFAHPDDETLALGGQLPRLSGIRIMCVTDGAPEDRRFWPADMSDRATYAGRRAAEFRSAMALAGIPDQAVVHAGLKDMTVLDHAAELARELNVMFRRHHISLVVTHAYEGGHPDHDGTALAVHAAAALMARAGLSAPTVTEVGLYRQREGRPDFGAAEDDGTALRIALNERALRRKRQMLDAYVSQASTIALFDPAVEVFRTAGQPDFTRLPNDGALLYSHFGFPITPDDMLRRNHTALHALGLSQVRQMDAPCP